MFQVLVCAGVVFPCSVAASPSWIGSLSGACVVFSFFSSVSILNLLMNVRVEICLFSRQSAVS